MMIVLMAFTLYPRGYSEAVVAIATGNERMPKMCRQVACRTCAKTTWAGCGQHVDQVMAGVPRRDRCEGHQKQPTEGGFFAKLFGR